MKKNELKQLMDAYQRALETIQSLWTARDCLHQCRWGSRTLDICNTVLEKPLAKIKCPNPGCHCGACE